MRDDTVVCLAWLHQRGVVWT